MKRIIKVAAIDDHPVVLQGYKQIFGNQTDIHLSGLYRNTKDFLKDLESKDVDILLYDFKKITTYQDELLHIIKSEYTHLRIIAVSFMDNFYYIKKLMKQGVSGYLLKTSSEIEIEIAVRTVFEGGEYLDHNLKEMLIQHTIFNKRQVTNIPKLTKREKEILQLIGSNYSSQQIAEKLFLSKRTVDQHRANLLTKLKVKNAPSMVKKAIEFDLL